MGYCYRIPSDSYIMENICRIRLLRRAGIQVFFWGDPELQQMKNGFIDAYFPLITQIEVKIPRIEGIRKVEQYIGSSKPIFNFAESLRFRFEQAISLYGK